DIDRDDLDVALRDTRRLSHFLADRYGTDPVIHFSGAKGFHASVATADFIEPAPDNHLVAKALACRIAGEVGIEVDEGIYDRVRLWRAPNSRHRRTGCHKVRIDVDDLLYVNADQVRRLAAEPIPYGIPAPALPPPRLVADWNEAANEVRRDAKRQARHGVADGEARTRINPLTRLLLTDPISVKVGERHKAILSAAADLAAFPTVDDLVATLLMSPGLDTGLPPREVRRQIECGIEMARRQKQAEGGAT
ncbi:MAG: hypothetical protein ACLQVF_08285, partial [Isosphaeraceae bacterium]